MIKEISLTPTSSPLEIPHPSGISIPARSWGSANDCKAVALLIHGLGAHGGWFEAFARQLKTRSYYALSYDHAGFGQQAGVPFNGYKQWLDDLVRVFDYVKKTVPDKPIYLIGNSMGGLLSVVSVDYIRPDGLVLLSPGLDGNPKCFTAWYRISAVISAILAPEKEIALPYGAESITRDLPTRDWINNDPQGRFSVPGKHLLELLKLSNAVKSKARRVEVPVLMLTAGQDKIVNNDVNRAFFARLSAPGKKSRRFEEAWHDLMFDPLVDEVANTVDEWVSELRVEQLTSG